MFIPRGKVLHENLATSYVLIDGLVEYLCEGGFSGVIEILLRASDCHIIIDRGRVAAAVEKRGDEAPSYTTVSLLAARSRIERGRVSIYSYPAGTAIALVGRVAAEPLYTGLSTEFADVEKMIAKLSRERDRQWFIDVKTAGDKAALIYLYDEKCIVIKEDEIADSDPTSSNALRQLLDECNRVGARFDVFFKRATPEEPVDLIAPVEPAELEIAIEENMVAAAAESRMPPDLPDIADTPPDLTRLDEPDFNYLLEATATDISEEEEEPETSLAEHAVLRKGLSPNTIRLFALPSMSDESQERIADSESSAQTEAGASGSMNEDLAMVEIKRLMGEIARTIEDAARAAEPHSKFSMYLRTGQLKVADRFPFLDPFGAEFEYLGGEIAFIGKASPAEFINGLTEALKLAVIGVAQSSAQPARLRRQIAEELRRLQSRIGPEAERFGLEKSIENILGV